MTHSETCRLCECRGDVMAWSTVAGETERAVRITLAAALGVAASGEFGHVGDIATELFIACERWDRWDASREVGRWLGSARGETAEALARAIRRAGAGPYLARYVELSRASRELARELPGTP